jgi:tRNA (guanine-N7-)-methyltransferase
MGGAVGCFGSHGPVLKSNVMTTSSTSPALMQALKQEPPASAAHPRPIRSFVLRTGRMGTGQERALAELGPRYILPFENRLLDLNAIKKEAFNLDFVPGSSLKEPKNASESAPVVFEIGFGMGDATAKIAQSLPGTLFLACEVHTPGVGALLKHMGEQQIRNIRIFQHDAVEVLAQMIPQAHLDGIHIFFPDPWHKKRHHKRRLIQAPFVATLAQHLKPGGYLHLATDWQPYAEQMLQVLSNEALLHNSSAHAHGFADKPAYRPLTKFENRGLKLGHGVWDLVFVKKAA